MGRIELPLLQGTLDVLVLKAIAARPRHGYAIARWIRGTTEGELQIEDRPLYISLHRMEARGWIESEWRLSEKNRRARYYSLTAEGQKQLQSSAKRWARYAEAVSRVLEAADAGA